MQKLTKAGNYFIRAVMSCLVAPATAASEYNELTEHIIAVLGTY